MANLSSAADDVTRAELLPELRELLSRLERSLHAGQQALLLRDLEKFEEQTALQASLSQTLAESLGGWDPGEIHLHVAGARVIHLCRVQRGLLRRAQRSLRVLSNLLAGAEGTYLPGPGGASSQRALSHKEG